MKNRLKTLLQIAFFLLLPLVAQAQSNTIKGKVIDENGEALIGVNIMLKGTTIGTVTDLDGNFIISNLDNESYQVTVSFVSFKEQELFVDLTSTSLEELNVVLVEDIEVLDQLVVIGYGTQKRSDLTSSVVSVSAEDLEEARASNIQEALQGRAAGVHVSSNTGAPGADVSVKIRGITSINGTDPIWIIDGVQGDASSVSSSDIESMEILKDASSAAIYGANAANGVILITTKKGKAGKTKVSYNSYWGVQNVTNSVDLASGPEFMEMYHEYETLSLKRSYLTEEPDTFKTYDYQDMIFRQALMQNYDLSMSGGNEKSTFFMGLSYTDQEGVLKNSDYNRISARFNGTHEATDWLTVGVNASFSQQTYEGFEEWELKDDYASPILASITFHNFVEPYADKQTTSEYDDGWNSSPLSNIRNPLAMIKLKDYERVTTSSRGTFFAKMTPFEGLSFETRLSGSIGNVRIDDFSPIFFVTNSYKNSVSSIMKRFDNSHSWNLQNLLTYNNTFFGVHNVSALVGYESGYSYYEYSQAERFDLINQSEEMRHFDASLDGESAGQFPSGSGDESSGYSYLGRLSYDYKSMLLAQVNFRHDYSSKFGPEYRDGIFPSWSVGFKFTELDVVKNLMPAVNFGKLRFGWGKAGNNSVRPYQYYATVISTEVYGYSFDNSEPSSVGIAPNGIPNLQIRWEDVETSNYGLDLGFFENRLTATVEYFERHNNGMLMTFEDAYYVGVVVEDADHEGDIAYADKNIGEFSNSGLEFALGWKEQRGIFNYGANANFTYIKTEVGDIEPDEITSGSAKGFGQSLTRTVQNQPYDIFYGYKTDGIFRMADTEDGDPSSPVTNQPFTTSPDGEITYAQPNAYPGDFKFQDINDDGVIDKDDQVALGSPHPKYTFALNLFCDVKLPNNGGVIDLKAFLQGVSGNKVFNATKFYLFNTDGAYNWSKDYYDNHYTMELYDRNDVLVTELNDDAKYPRVDPRGQNENFSTMSDFYIEDASYIRMKNLELGYTLSSNITKKVQIEKIRIYGAVKNLFTITNYTGLDPEVGGNRNSNGFSDPSSVGIDKGSYPTSRMWSLGLNVIF